MLFSRNWLNSSLIFPVTVTVPCFVGWTNWRWSPRVRSSFHPSCWSRSITCLTLYLLISRHLIVSRNKGIQIYTFFQIIPSCTVQRYAYRPSNKNSEMKFFDSRLFPKKAKKWRGSSLLNVVSPNRRRPIAAWMPSDGDDAGTSGSYRRQAPET